MIKLICDRCAVPFTRTSETERGGSFRIQRRSITNTDWDHIYQDRFELCANCLDSFDKVLDEFTGVNPVRRKENA